MQDALNIDVDNILKPSEDFYFLKKQAIKMIEELSGSVWSDYNTHDPGITLLEALCYTLTDLGYRTSMDVKDLLAYNNPQKSVENLFYTARQILPCNPVTLTDYRKLIIDTEGVRNAWVEVSNEMETSVFIETANEDNADKPQYHLTYEADNASGLVTLNGLYKVFIEFEDDIKTDAERDKVMLVIYNKLQFHRNLCEDFVSISPVEYELFTIKAELKVSEGADIEKINAQVYKVIHDFISPPVKFHTLEQMLAKGFTVEDIFEGPVLKHGFIITKELEDSEKFKSIHISDIIYIILNIEGVIAITNLSMPADNDAPFSDFNEWLQNIEKQQKKPRIDTLNSVVTFARSGDRHRTEAERQPDKQKVQALLSFMQLTDARSKLKSYTKDVLPPAGEYMNLTDYFPVQQTLPSMYGMKEKLVDNSLDETTFYSAVNEWKNYHQHHHQPTKSAVRLSAKTKALAQFAETSLNRKIDEFNTPEEFKQFKQAYIEYQLAQLNKDKKLALQLKGFLLFFEQLLSDYLQQLSSLKDFFSFDAVVQEQYSPFMLHQVHDLECLIIDYKKFISGHNELIDTDSGYFNKQATVLNHLLGRFAEDMYVINNRPNMNYNKEKQSLLDKSNLLKDYIQVSNYRGKAYTYNIPGDVWDTDNVEGVKKRICRLTGIAGYKREYIASDAIFIEEIILENEVKRFVVILVDPANREQLLLRSVEYEFRGEAEETMNYIMLNGADKKLYDLNEKKDKSYYHLKRTSQELERETVASYSSHNKQETEETFRRCLAVLGDFAANENFHVLEHILLRPKINGRQNSQKQKNRNIDADVVKLLPVNDTTVEGLSFEQKEQTLRYQFKVINRQKNKGAENPLWSVQLVLTENEEVVLNVPDTFIFYKHALERIERIKKAAADQESYQIPQDADGYYLLRINDNQHLIAEGKRKFKAKEDLDKLTDDLIHFFSFEFKDVETNADEAAPDVASVLDPYSFQVSIVLPNWPARFRDVSFKHLLEKAIFLETPAHITPTIYWVNHEQMREFENAYRYWIQELAENEMPNTDITNKLIHVLHKLKE